MQAARQNYGQQFWWEAGGAGVHSANSICATSLGYVEGKNITFEYQSADNKLDRLLSLAEELVRLKVDLLITRGTPEALALKNATRTIPMFSMT
jgi:ABC-type uncharacterized transport system substrate-binding protein